MSTSRSTRRRLSSTAFLLAAVVALLAPVLFLQGCAQLGATTTPVFVAPKDTAQTGVLTKAIAAEVLTQADILLTAQAIKPADARNLVAQTDTVVSAVDVATGLLATDKAAAADRMTTALATVRSLRDYLVRRGATFTPAATG